MKDRKLKYAKAELRKACQELTRLKSGRANALEAVGKKLGWMIEQKWISEAEYYEGLRAASVHNGLADIDSPQAIDRCIREGLEVGRRRPQNGGLDNPSPNAPNESSGAARTAKWKATHKAHYTDYMRGYMVHWRMKRRLAAQR